MCGLKNKTFKDNPKAFPSDERHTGNWTLSTNFSTKENPIRKCRLYTHAEKVAARLAAQTAEQAQVSELKKQRSEERESKNTREAKPEFVETALSDGIFFFLPAIQDDIS